MVLKSTQEEQERQAIEVELGHLVGRASGHFIALENCEKAMKVCQDRGFVGLYHEASKMKTLALATIRQIEDAICEKQDALGIERIEMPPPF